MKIGLFIKNNIINEKAQKELTSKIVKLGHTIDDSNPELVFTVGGDGTFLRAVHKYIDQLNEITFVSLNKGKVAFFSDFEIEDVEEVLKNLDEFKKASFGLLSCRINKEEIYAVNEIRIENPFHTLISEVYINDIYLETFRGNGLVVSTSLGSSAYNKSLSGAVVDTSLEVLQLNEIAPINNYVYSSLKSPLILSRDSEIVFRGDFSGVVIGFDHLVKSDYQSNELRFKLSNKKVTVLWKKDHNHISRLSETFITGR